MILPPPNGSTEGVTHSRLTIRRRITQRRNMAKRRESPIGRLSEDRASSPRNISRRLSWIAIEWHLEAPPKIGRGPWEALADYCTRHRISFDWMLTGCPVDLKKMVDARRIRLAAVPSAATCPAHARAPGDRDGRDLPHHGGARPMKRRRRLSR